VLYNPLARNSTCKQSLEKLKEHLSNDEYEIEDMTKISSYNDFFDSIDAERGIIVCGGDGTLNRFVNDTQGIDYKNDVYYFAGGSGNDFWNDLGRKYGDAPICINKYLENLPEISVNNMKKKFINGIGYGIDGYCCEEGDRLRETSTKAINYTNIAIKGLLYAFKPRNAEVIVDGKSKKYKKVWLAPTMNGRFFGGGMMPTPNQDRLNEEHTLSTMVFSGYGKLRTLMIFPNIFKGTHVKNKNIDFYTGKDITVKFDRPTPLQIDGETVSNVTEYTVHAAKSIKEKEEQFAAAL
jgi:diacylglycerol kinase family enzyme